MAAFRHGRPEVLLNDLGQKWTPSIIALRRDATLAFREEAKGDLAEQCSIRSTKRVVGTSERCRWSHRTSAPNRSP